MTEINLKIRDSSDSQEALKGTFAIHCDGAINGIWQIDRNGVTTYANRYLADMLGYEDEHCLTGMPLAAFILDEDMPDHLHQLRNRQSGQQGMYERRFRRKDGSECWCLVMALPLSDGEGKIAGSIAMVKDYNDHKKNEGAWFRQLACMHALNDLSTVNYSSLEEKLNRALMIGAGLYGLDEGMVGRIDRDHYQVMARLSGSGEEQCAPIQVAEAFHELERDKDGVFAVESMGNSAWRHLSGCSSYGLGAYIGAPIKVSGEFFGKICFASQASYPRQFDQVDFDFISLLGRWIGSAIERRLAQTRLQESEARYRNVIDNIKEVVFQTDAQGNWTFLNRAWEEVTGFQIAESIGKFFLDYVYPEDRQRNRELFELLIRQEKDYCRHEVRYLHKDGEFRWIEIFARRTNDDASQIIGISGTLRDVTERKRSEKQLHQAAGVFTHVREGIMITDANGSILDVNEAFQRITGYQKNDVLGMNPRLLQSGRQDADFYLEMWSELRRNGYWQGEVWNRRKNGELYIELLTISAIRDAKGGLANYVGLFSDITAQKEHQQQLEYIAHYDALTGLPNRLLLADRLRQSIVRGNRSGSKLAVAYIDLDGFKAVNDLHGHQVGDEFLIKLAERMSRTIRESDTIARLGGDEFVAVLNDLSTHEESLLMLSRLMGVVTQPVQLGDLVLQVTASIGVAYYPQPEDVDADQLMRQADQAMYQAKLSGKNRYYVFDTDQHRNARGRHESLQSIRQAIHRGEFVLHYQPIVDLHNGKTVAMEALIRWNHPQRGLLSPAAFLPLIEEHPLIVELGDWVFQAALTQIRLWHQNGIELPVSVNVSGRQLQQIDFIDKLKGKLAEFPDIPPSMLKLEILEVSALEDIEHVSRIIHACEKLGILFALDDFGTGYSSLLYFKRLPASIIKIDQSFVRDMLDDPDDLAILQGVIGLSKAFRREVVAEGVETEDHAELLLQLGCNHVQGYGIARPMHGDQVVSWLSAWKPNPVWRSKIQLGQKELNLLLIGVEYRAWIKRLQAYMNSDRKSHSLPPLAHLLDQVESAGRSSTDMSTEMTHARQILNQAYRLAKNLVSMKEKGMEEDSRNEYEKIQALSEGLMKNINKLVDYHVMSKADACNHDPQVVHS